MKNNNDQHIDQLFKQTFFDTGKFEFNEDVVDVFDDMIQRSIPHYQSLQKMIASIVCQYFVSGTHIYDLGCSTGNSVLCIAELLCDQHQNFTIFGYDQSSEMIDRVSHKLTQYDFRNHIRLATCDISKSFELVNASVVLLNLVLQFIKPSLRLDILTRIYDSLLPGGCLILVEKVKFSSVEIDDFYKDEYYSLKRQQGYSNIEIKHKEKALQDVLIPFSVTQNRDLLQSAGFEIVETFFQWYNFNGMIALKL